MRFKYLSIVSAVLAVSGSVFAVSSANAADLYEKASVPAATTEQAYSWSGFYAGGEVGGAWNRFLNKVMHYGSTVVGPKFNPGDVQPVLPVNPGKPANFDAVVPEHTDYWKEQVNSNTTSSSGFIGGLFIGYNYQLSNNIVLGVDTDMIASSSDKARNGSFSMGNPFGFDISPQDNDNVNVKYHNSVHQRWQGSTRIRVGYALDRFLPYVAIGVAYGDVGSDFTASAVSGETTYKYRNNYNRVRAGWTVGAGVDYAMTNHIMLRAEYRYTGFGNQSGLASGFADSYGVASAFNNKVDMHQNDFRVGVAYKF